MYLPASWVLGSKVWPTISYVQLYRTICHKCLSNHILFKLYNCQSKHYISPDNLKGKPQGHNSVFDSSKGTHTQMLTTGPWGSRCWPALLLSPRQWRTGAQCCWWHQTISCSQPCHRSDPLTADAQKTPFLDSLIGCEGPRSNLEALARADSSCKGPGECSCHFRALDLFFFYLSVCSGLTEFQNSWCTLISTVVSVRRGTVLGVVLHAFSPTRELWVQG